YKSNIKTEVTIKNQKIEDIKVISSNDTNIISDAAFNNIKKDIIETQGLGVDMVAGSNGFYRSIIEALKSSGANISELRKIKKEKVLTKEKRELNTDVLVIGGGGAGLAAASSATENGAKVILIEKMSFLGGNTILAGGAYNAVDPKRQKPMNIEDSNELFYKQTFEGGDKKGNPKLVKILTDNAYSGIEWLEGKGMKFKDDVFTVLGALYPRSHKPIEPVGTGFILTYEKFLKENSVPILLNAQAKELIVENNRVVGAIVETPKEILTIKSKNGVVLATGGFSKNIEYRTKYNPKLTENILSTNTPAATGDGINLSQMVNANLIGMEDIQMLPLGNPKTGSLSGNIETTVEDRIFVNKKGERFVAEDERRDVMTNTLLNQPDALLYVIVDSQVYPNENDKNNFNESIKELVDENRAIKANSLEELAKKLEMDPKVLTKTIKDYNLAVDKKSDEFGRKLFGKKIEKAPFYAGARIPTIHHTMGGVEINENTEVLNKKGEVIEGLFAAGEVTGGIHGTNRLGGNALADITVFGKIAGEKAASNK
ncbi:MAG: flavocytochrome c, partial [Cetobacterium sp.]